MDPFRVKFDPGVLECIIQCYKVHVLIVIIFSYQNTICDTCFTLIMINYLLIADQYTLS